MALITALLDANILYPAPLRDLFMRLAEVSLVQPKWSADIHEEWIRNLLVNRPEFTRAQLERTRDKMNQHAGECLVAGYDSLVPTLADINPGDRHIVAAAIVGGVEVIVTFNLRHFPPSILARHGLECQHPDEFVCELFDLDPELVQEAVRRQRTNLKIHPKTAIELLETFINNRLPQFAERLRERIDEL